MNTLFHAVVTGTLLIASGAEAKGKPSTPTHHCVKDGAEVTGASKKECKKQSGTWEKIATPTAATGAATPPAATPPPAQGGDAPAAAKAP